MRIQSYSEPLYGITHYVSRFTPDISHKTSSPDHPIFYQNVKNTKIPSQNQADSKKY